MWSTAYFLLFCSGAANGRIFQGCRHGANGLLNLPLIPPSITALRQNHMFANTLLRVVAQSSISVCNAQSCTITDPELTWNRPDPIALNCECSSCIVFVHLYSASLSTSLSEALTVH